MGPAGFDGEVGEIGERGEQGPQGVQGLQGLRGEPGEQGPQGVQGLQGLRGEPGEQGSQGIQGIQGEIGPIGPRGETGPQGPKGATDLIDVMAVISPIGFPRESIPCISTGSRIPTYELVGPVSDMPNTTFNRESGTITFNDAESTPNTHTYLVTYTITGTIGTDDALTIIPFINHLPQSQWQTTATTNGNHTTTTNSTSFVYNNIHFETEKQNNLTFQVKTLSGRPITNVYGSYHIVQLS